MWGRGLEPLLSGKKKKKQVSNIFTPALLVAKKFTISFAVLVKQTYRKERETVHSLSGNRI